MINTLNFIARYVNLLRRHNALKGIIIKGIYGMEECIVAIITNKKAVTFTPSESGMWVEKTELQSCFLDSVHQLYIMEVNRETYKCNYIKHDRDVIPYIYKEDIIASIGATVVAPSDFQNPYAPKTENQ